MSDLNSNQNVAPSTSDSHSNREHANSPPQPRPTPPPKFILVSDGNITEKYTLDEGSKDRSALANAETDDDEPNAQVVEATDKEKEDRSALENADTDNEEPSPQAVAVALPQPTLALYKPCHGTYHCEHGITTDQFCFACIITFCNCSWDNDGCKWCKGCDPVLRFLLNTSISLASLADLEALQSDSKKWASHIKTKHRPNFIGDAWEIKLDKHLNRDTRIDQRIANKAKYLRSVAGLHHHIEGPLLANQNNPMYNYRFYTIRTKEKLVMRKEEQKLRDEFDAALRLEMDKKRKVPPEPAQDSKRPPRRPPAPPLGCGGVAIVCPTNKKVPCRSKPSTHREKDVPERVETRPSVGLGSGLVHDERYIQAFTTEIRNIFTQHGGQYSDETLMARRYQPDLWRIEFGNRFFNNPHHYGMENNYLIHRVVQDYMRFRGLL